MATTTTTTTTPSRKLWQPRPSGAEIPEGDAENRVWVNGFLLRFTTRAKKGDEKVN
jgi:hypothetical protein